MAYRDSIDYRPNSTHGNKRILEKTSLIVSTNAAVCEPQEQEEGEAKVAVVVVYFYFL